MGSMSFQDLISQAVRSGELDAEEAKLDFALGLARQLERAGLSKAELAERLGVSKPFVTRMLRGDSNLTIETMAKAAKAAGGRLHLHVAPEGQAVRWFEIIRACHPRSVAVRYPASLEGQHHWHHAANDHETESVAA
ncbi:helix-turn-helix transcriptional regulator [Silanimonas lenta]|uniref:helix-turn-helix domain-containing protein n=1 Tax=Silanimonas lenta TaxID=265429 RepID=UPI002FE28658